MSIYFNLFYRRPKSEYSPDDELSVQVFYYFQKRKLNISTGITVKIKDWDEDWENNHGKNPVKKSDSEHQSKNILIKQKIREVEDIVIRTKLKSQIPTVDIVKSFLNQNQKIRIKETRKELDFLFVLDLYLKYLNQNIVLRENYKKSVRTGLIRIQEFVRKEYGSKSKLLFTDIDDEFQKGFLRFLSDLGDQPSTIRKRIKILVSMVNWSRDNGYTSHQIKITKFKHSFEKDVIYLLREEVLQLYNFKKFNYDSSTHRKYTYEYIIDHLKNGKTVTYTNYEVYRDMIVFGCGVGCRYGDLVNLKLDNYEFSEDRTKGFFVFRMEKSQTGRKVKVPVNQLTFELWKKYSKNKERENYLFPRNSKNKSIDNQKVNFNIKKISKIVGLTRLVENPKFDMEGKIVEGTDTRVPLHEVITTHIIRRTFIREGIENKIPTHILMSMSGHSTEQVFRKYFSTTTKELDSEGNKMFSLILVDKTPKNKKETNDQSVENKLIELKKLYEKGLIPESIYLERVKTLI